MILGLRACVVDIRWQGRPIPPEWMLNLIGRGAQSGAEHSDVRYTPAYAQLYKRRKEAIERVFATVKEKHAMRYTQYRGLAQMTNWAKLKFAAINAPEECYMPQK